MSVVQGKRHEGLLTVITKANELAVYTIKICGNEKNFPKHYRWCITSKIVDAVLEINNCIVKANSIYVTTGTDYEDRRRFQTLALSNTYALLSMIDIAYRTFGIESDRIKYWTGLVVEVQGYLRNWKKSDAERYRKITQVST